MRVGLNRWSCISMCKKLVTEIRADFSSNDGYMEENIEKAANKLSTEVLSHYDGQKFPFPIVSFLQQLGFELFRTRFSQDAQSGLIAIDSRLPERMSVCHSDRAIFVNSNDSVEHQRFTIAHEIAHYIFDFDEATQLAFYDPYFTDYNEETEKDINRANESRACRFAAALLMPADDFKKQYDAIKDEQGTGFSLSSTVTKLSKYFGTPATAVIRRMKELELADVE